MGSEIAGANLRHGELTSKIIRCAIKVHRTLGHGFPEKVYHAAVVREMLLAKLVFESEKKFEVWYEDSLCGEFFADLVVEGKVIVEFKALDALTSVHESQCLTYLKASRLGLALLINFGEELIKVKRIIR